MHIMEQDEKKFIFLCYYCGTQVTIDFIKPYTELLENPEFVEEMYEWDSYLYADVMLHMLVTEKSQMKKNVLVVCISILSKNNH